MKNLTPYKDTLVGKGSQLADAIEVSPAAAKKVYEATTARFDAMYPSAAADRAWFRSWKLPTAAEKVECGQCQGAECTDCNGKGFVWEPKE